MEERAAEAGVVGEATGEEEEIALGDDAASFAASTSRRKNRRRKAPTRPPLPPPPPSPPTPPPPSPPAPLVSPQEMKNIRDNAVECRPQTPFEGGWPGDFEILMARFDMVFGDYRTASPRGPSCWNSHIGSPACQSK